MKTLFRTLRHFKSHGGRLGEALDAFFFSMKKGLTLFVPDATYAKVYYATRLGRWPNLREPSGLNEKIQWLKLYYRHDLMPELADKWKVRSYVRRRVGPDVLVPVHGVYRSERDIHLKELPNRFVLKPTHGSGWVVICQDRAHFDWDTARRRLEKWMRRDYYYHAREWVYKGLEPRIICEELLQDVDGTIPNDYKVFCFGGRPRFIQVDIDRFRKHRRNLYDLEWNRIPAEILYPGADQDPPRPVCLREMLDAAAALAEPFPLCRVDFYVIGSRYYFGELTFFPGNGVEEIRPALYDRLFGDELLLPERREMTAVAG